MKSTAVLLLAACVFLGSQADAADSDSLDENHWSHFGLLRARDLTPFGLLRLDMLPARTADAPSGTWAFEASYAYQNTFVLSDNVRDYLATRGGGRQSLHSADAAAILALPGDAYYFDGEVGIADLTAERRFSNYWSAYVTVPYIRYGQGAFDRAVESFHDTFGFSQMGREYVARNRFQIVYKVHGAQVVQLERETDGGFGDPVFGLRYSLPEPRWGWDVVAEFAAKIAVDGDRFLLSTGRNDYGAQLAIARRFGATGRHALMFSAGAVYYAGGPANTLGSESEIIPTLIAGYSYGITQRTSFILQGYASRSVVQNSSLEELKDNKYQLSFGIQSRRANFLWGIALTENISNFENTPDIGAQLNLAYVPHAR